MVGLCFVFFQDAFSDIALFFHDVYGGDWIGIVWKPQSFVPAPFKVQEAFGVFYPSVLVRFIFRFSIPRHVGVVLASCLVHSSPDHS